MTTAQQRIRSGVTLLVLGLMVFGALAFGWSQVAKPFPQSEDPPICSEVPFTEGDEVRPADVTVSVLNGGERSGRASSVMTALVEVGFGRGSVADAPEGTEVEVVQIWTDDRRDPAVRLVRSWLGAKSKVRVLEQDATAPGVNIVIGDDYGDVRSEGRDQVNVKDDTTICSPPIGSDPRQPLEPE